MLIENEIEDDGLVMIEGELYLPEIVHNAMIKKFKNCDGLVASSLIKRYSKCYPHVDNTTPSFREFKMIVGDKRKKK